MSAAVIGSTVLVRTPAGLPVYQTTAVSEFLERETNVSDASQTLAPLLSPVNSVVISTSTSDYLAVHSAGPGRGREAAEVNGWRPSRAVP